MLGKQVPAPPLPALLRLPLPSRAARQACRFLGSKQFVERVSHRLSDMGGEGEMEQPPWDRLAGFIPGSLHTHTLTHTHTHSHTVSHTLTFTHTYSHTLTHTHTHTCTHTHIQSHTHTHTPSHNTHTHTHVHIHTHSHTHSHNTHTHTFMHTHCNTYTHSLTHSHTHAHTHTRSHIHTLSLSLTHTHHGALPCPVDQWPMEKDTRREVRGAALAASGSWCNPELGKEDLKGLQGSVDQNAAIHVSRILL